LTLEPSGSQVFDDVPPGTFGYAEINALYKAGYTSGCGQSSGGMPNYCPTVDITRAVLAAFVYNAFVLETPVPPSIPPETSTPTVTPTETDSTFTGESGSSGGTSESSAGVSETGTSATTGSAQTGAEIPIAGGGILSVLLLARYLVGKRIK
jgi:hypothetical protein